MSEGAIYAASDPEPSRKAVQELIARPVASSEVYCKYCDVTHATPGHLRGHVFTEHWATNRRAFYQKDADFVEYLREADRHRRRWGGKQ